MELIKTLRKAISKKHPCDPAHKSLDEVESLINEAFKYFSPLHDFEIDKKDWLQRVEQIDL